MTTVETAVAVEHATIAHALPGRIRLRMPASWRDPLRLADLEQRLAAIEEIELARVNPRTGSVVIEYLPELNDSVEILERISQNLGIEIDAAATGSRLWPEEHVSSSEAAQGLRTLIQEANERVSRQTGGLDLRILVPGALFVLGVGVFMGAKRRRMPAWHDLIWYSYNLFQELNPREHVEDFTER
jgi:hypothetical protein